VGLEQASGSYYGCFTYYQEDDSSRFLQDVGILLLNIAGVCEFGGCNSSASEDSIILDMMLCLWVNESHYPLGYISDFNLLHTAL
jgi:hypothetical protein